MIKKEKKGGKVNVFKRILTTTTQSLVIVPSQGTLDKARYKADFRFFELLVNMVNAENVVNVVNIIKA